MLLNKETFETIADECFGYNADNCYTCSQITLLDITRAEIYVKDAINFKSCCNEDNYTFTNCNSCSYLDKVAKGIVFKILVDLKYEHSEESYNIDSDVLQYLSYLGLFSYKH